MAGISLSVFLLGSFNYGFSVVLGTDPVETQGIGFFFNSQATFLKLAGPQLVQMFIGDGAKLVRDAFALAKEKAPSIIFIDELDAIGTKR